MLVAIDGIVGEFTPTPVPLTLTVSGNQARLGALKAGVTYYVVKEHGLDVTIDPTTGKFTTKGRGEATIRAICGSVAYDKVIRSADVFPARAG